jgi:hypothetical protein
MVYKFLVGTPASELATAIQFTVSLDGERPKTFLTTVATVCEQCVLFYYLRIMAEIIE